MVGLVGARLFLSLLAAVGSLLALLASLALLSALFAGLLAALFPLLRAFLPAFGAIRIARAGNGPAVCAECLGFTRMVLFDLFVPGFLLFLHQFRVRLGCGRWPVGIFLERVARLPVTVLHDDFDQLITDVVAGFFRQLVDFLQVLPVGRDGVAESRVPVAGVLEFHAAPECFIAFLDLLAGAAFGRSFRRVVLGVGGRVGQQRQEQGQEGESRGQAAGFQGQLVH